MFTFISVLFDILIFVIFIRMAIDMNNMSKDVHALLEIEKKRKKE